MPSAAAALRVLIVVHSWVSQWRGGTEIYAAGFARALAARGAEVTVLHPVPTSAADHGHVPELETTREGPLRVLRLRVEGVRTLERDRSHPPVEQRFSELLARECFDVVHFQHTHAHLPLRLIPLARASGARVCLTIHDAWLLCAQTHLLRPGSDRLCSGPESIAKCASCLTGGRPVEPALGERFESLLRERAAAARAALDACHVVSAPSRHMLEIHARYGLGARIQLAPLGLAPLHCPPRAADGRVAFGFLGSWNELKNPLLLARAFARVRGPATLSFHGEGDAGLGKLLRARAREDPRIRVAGAYAPESLAAVLGDLDVVVLPSRFENYPLVVREALAAGRPVIASRVGGIPEILEEGRSGLFFADGDEAGLAACMQRILDDPALLAHLRAGIRPPKTLSADAEEWLARYADCPGAEAGDPQAKRAASAAPQADFAHR